MHRTALLLIVGIGSSCALEEPELSETDAELLAANKITSNKITSNKLLASTLGAVQLSGAALGGSGMLDTSDARDVLSYIVACALPASQSVTATGADGIAYTFPGQLGLAPQWAARPPTVSERRWVTACLLARTNLYGVEVPISMRNDANPALATTSAERTTFYLVEGAFYGDLFKPKPELYACGARPWVTPKHNTARACALSPDGITTDCGFQYAGLCTSSKDPCSDALAPFGTCSGGGIAYAEVITIFLRTQ